MSTRIRMILALLVATLALGAPAAAQAGCQVYPNATQNPSSSAITTSSRVGCTSNNGAHYTLRIYIQGNSGGWHSVSTGALWDIFSPGTNYNQTFHASFGCAMFAVADTQGRNKSVLTNVASGTQDVEYGPAVTLRSDCQ